MAGDIIYKLLAGYVTVLWFCGCAAATAHFRQLTSYDRSGRDLLAADLSRGSINPLKRIIFLVDAAPLAAPYLDADNYNVFVVDRTGSAAEAGAELGEFAAALLEKTGERYLDLHLVGGGAVAGVAAREVEKRAGRKVNRVTVLGGEEEAGPARAEFVDVVVCGGEGREEGEVKERVEFVVVEKGGGEKCNTAKIIDLFAKSISSSEIKAKQCADYKTFLSGSCADGKEVVFGDNVGREVRGKYFVAL